MDEQKTEEYSYLMIMDETCRTTRLIPNEDFVGDVCRELDRLTPGQPVSDQLMIHLVSPSPLPELTQDNAGRYMKDITPKLDDHTIKIAAAVSLKDAVYALEHDIPITQMAEKSKRQTLPEDYQQAVDGYGVAAPDLREKVAQLRREEGEKTVLLLSIDTWTHEACNMKMDARKNFVDFVNEELRRIEPGKPIPYLSFQAIEPDQMALVGLQQQDRQINIAHIKGAPKQSLSIIDIVGCQQQGLNPLDPVDVESFRRQTLGSPQKLNQLLGLLNCAPESLQLKTSHDSTRQTQEQNQRHVPRQESAKHKKVTI